ncbi:TnsA endonuclease N-terminal domain-containing protein [Halomonas vilamensis]|uniref:TnsA endonuclease N-terminal domain-containing protein n=1 Tax=Vreelandella vilamensis TaxID=531309 RepID=A0ABU1H3I6_9GAMM|nr:TnsA endonuclease N-terminal domain-containing protein [Halomonas vilamensis]MDR5898860.1 TnsA endonuclease N-terminal domain-containing protein [Halomonas vilamensis]
MSDTNKLVDPKHKKLLKTRGRGIGRDYEPFIKVHEMSSQGESVRIRSATVGRVHHLLSGIELQAFLVFDQFERTIDIREQYPLPVEDTLDICERLGIRHPQVRGNLTVVTTDLLINFDDGTQLAVAVKSSSELGKQRVIEKLQIEKSYWELNGAEWKLFTEREVSDGLRENLSWIQPYLAEEAAVDYQLTAVEVEDLLARLRQHPRTQVTRLCAKFDDQYGVEPGFHLSTLRFAVAHRFIRAPLDKPFHSWTFKDLTLRESAWAGEVHHAS